MQLAVVETLRRVIPKKKPTTLVGDREKDEERRIYALVALDV